MRSFEFRDGKSNKFWTIDLQGNAFTVTFGRIGSAGQTQTKELADDAAARKEHDKLVKEKLAKGYVETTAGAAAAGGSLRDALEAALVANPDDLASHSAYADYLAEQGDPRGELIQVQIALEDEKKASAERKRLQEREAELLKAHTRQWLGELAPHLLDIEERKWGPNTEYRFARGWVDRLQIVNLSAALAEAFCRTPLLRLLRELLVEEHSYDEDEPTGLEELAAAPYLGNVRLFQLGPEGNCHIRGEQAVEFVRKMPRLEELRMYAHRVDTRELFALPMPHLRVLHVHHTYDYPLEVLAANPSLGNLTTLALWPHALEPGDDHAYIPFEAVRALVHSPHVKGLTHLHIYLSDLGDEGCAEIVRSGILKRLKVLDLWGGRVSDAGARALAGCPDLRHLERLRIDHNQLTAAGLAALRASGVPVESKYQYNEDGIRDHEYLFEGDCE
jgi:uncharacterized protein (TIGR02996 family)